MSTKCARKHLQLAYLCTLHGAGSDFADASVVEPDFDAAQLYVDLARGWMHQVAIVKACILDDHLGLVS